MEVKDLLKSYQGDNYIEIYDSLSWETTRYNNKKSAIRNFGHFIVQSWVVLTTQSKLKITIRSHFDLIKCDLRRGREC